MKTNRLSIIFYALCILCVLFLLIVLEQPFLLPLLLPFAAAPFLSGVLFRHVTGQLHFRAYGKTTSVELGNPVIFIIEADNKALIPLFRCEISFHTENLFLPNETEQTLSIPLTARKTSVFEIPIEARLPGMVSFHISEILVSDYFHFFSHSFKPAIMLQIPVLPAKEDIALPDTTVAAEGEEETEDNSNRGMPSSDVKEIREYRPGDRLQRIHWKLSAKLDDLFVKELSNTSVLSMVILPEMTKNCISETTTALRAVMERLLQQEQRFELCLYQHADCTFEYILVSNQDELQDCFIKFYYLSLYEEEDAALNAFIASSQHGASVIQIKGTNVRYVIPDNTVF